MQFGKVNFTMSESSIRWATGVCLVAILGLSLFLNLRNNDFGLLHIDEHFKAETIAGRQKHDFHHPMLIMQAARIPAAILGYTGNREVLILARTTTAVWGTLSVLFIFLISRFVLPRPWALLVAAGVAFSPIMVIHSHYLKEDIIFCCFALFSLWRYIIFVDRHTRANALWLGVAFGLALSSQYKAVLLLAMFTLLPITLRGIKYKEFYWNLGLISIPVAIPVVLIANYPLFYDIPHFWAGLTFSADLTMSGYAVTVYPLDHWFSFHFRHSLMPGLTAAVAFLGLVGIVSRLKVWRGLPNTEKILLTHALVFYLAVELTPLKPFPAFIRYVIPAVPAVIFFAVRGISLGWDRYGSATWGKAVCAVLAVGLLAWPLHDSMHLTYHIDKDTRDKAQLWMQKAPYNVMCELYVWPFAPVVKRFGDHSVEEWRAQGYEFLVASSFMYERYLYALTQRNQDPEVYAIGRNYEEMFTYPYEEIKPEFKSFAFSNPVLRIVDIRKKP